MVRTRGGLIKSPCDPGGSPPGRRLRSSRTSSRPKNPPMPSTSSSTSSSLSSGGDLYNRNESIQGHWIGPGTNNNNNIRQNEAEHNESSALSQTGVLEPPDPIIQSSNNPPIAGSSGTNSTPNNDNNDLVIYGTRDSGVQTVGSPNECSSGANNSKSLGASLGLGGIRQTTQLAEDLKINLECPVCGRISLPPIMQCRNGHVTCNACRPKVQSCPVCREIDIDIRNMFAEKAITYLTIQCEFDQYGCKEIIQFRDKEAHERTCKFRPYVCPYIECDHKLSADVVVDHVSSAHREECRRSDGPEITASMILIGRYFGGDGAWSPRVITCFGKTFFDVALTRDRWLHHWVWLLGEEDEAMKYLYEITAFKGNTRYVYGGEVASLRTTDDDIVSGGQCLSISDAIGRRLRDGDKIRYKLKLMRKSEVDLKR